MYVHIIFKHTPERILVGMPKCREKGERELNSTKKDFERKTVRWVCVRDERVVPSWREEEIYKYIHYKYESKRLNGRKRTGSLKKKKYSDK